MARATVFQLKVTLQRIRPPIWRRLQVPTRMRLSELHGTLQVTMGWANTRLHLFRTDRFYFGPPSLELGLKVNQERMYRVDEVLRRPKDRLRYDYDFSEGWSHDVVLERITLPSADSPCPCVLAGMRNCPPEDVGGPHGYERFLEAIRDSRHPEHRDMRRWWGGSFDPEAFSLDEINRALQHRRLRTTW